MVASHSLGWKAHCNEVDDGIVRQEWLNVHAFFMLASSGCCPVVGIYAVNGTLRLEALGIWACINLWKQGEPRLQHPLSVLEMGQGIQLLHVCIDLSVS